MAQVKEEPRGPCGPWGPAQEDALREGRKLPRLKEEEPELCIKQEPQEFPFHMVTVKSEDDEDKSSVLHQRPTEEKREETNVWECGAEAGCSSDPLTQFHSDSEEHTDSSEDTDHSQDYSQEQAPAKRRSYAMVPPDSAHLRDARPHRCPECAKDFPQKERLDNHLRSEHHVCTVCDERFPDDVNLEEHLMSYEEHRTVHPSNPKPRAFCSLEFPNGGAALSGHVEVDEAEKPFSCSVCGKGFIDSSDLKVHVKSHSGQKPHVCSVCGKGFSVRWDLSLHQKRDHHICPDCGEHFPNNVELKEHLKGHAPLDGMRGPPLFLKRNNKSRVCSECGKEFICAAYLQRHMVVHTGERPFRCSVCDKTFAQKSYLQSHQRSHSEERPHACPVCGKGFITSFHLKRHMKGKHAEEHPPEPPGLDPHPTFSCSQCQKKFYDLSHLRKHAAVHLERPFRCSVCDHTFTLKSTLKRHQRIHSGERPYRCSVCAKAFTTNAHLKSHLKTHAKSQGAEPTPAPAPEQDTFLFEP